MTDMFLTFDIGNTTVSWAVIKGSRIGPVNSLRLSDTDYRDSGRFSGRVRETLPGKVNPAAILICSVVPDQTHFIQRVMRESFSSRIWEMGKDIVVPIPNRYNSPEQVGQDRLLVSYAARSIYGVPALIIDFGTAITFDVVNRRGEYRGGLIVPGMELSAQSLNLKTALLPHVDWSRPSVRLVGRDSEESILSGLINGYSALTEGLIDRLSAESGEVPKVILTGGYAVLMKRLVRAKNYITDKNLIFKGMRLLTQSGIKT